MNDDVIVFYWWWEDGIRKYRCSGIGPKYKDFYQNWIPTSSYRCTWDDFPWDFFVFDNPEDHERLIAKFPDDVFEEMVDDISYLENRVDVIFEEENGTKTMYIQGPFAIAERVDGVSGRRFGTGLLSREINRYNEERIKRDLGFVELGYAGETKVNLANISCLIVSLTQEGNIWIGKARILETPAGKTARNLLESGAHYKVCFYGIGSTQKVDGVFVVQDDYELIGFFLVPEGM